MIEKPTTPVDLEARLAALSEAIAAHGLTLSEMADLMEKQADLVAGVVQVLQATIDLSMNEKQRAFLEAYLAMMKPDHDP